MCVGSGGQALINHGALNSSSIRDTFGRDFYLLKEVIAPHGNVIEYAQQGTREVCCVCVWGGGGRLYMRTCLKNHLTSAAAATSGKPENRKTDPHKPYGLHFSLLRVSY